MKNNIRTVRKDNKITLEKLSDLTGISTSYLSRIEAGSRKLSLENLDIIAKALRVDSSRLVDNGPSIQTPNLKLAPYFSWEDLMAIARGEEPDTKRNLGNTVVIGATGNNLLALEVKENNATNIAPIGSTLIVDRDDTTPEDGKVYIVTLNYDKLLDDASSAVNSMVVKYHSTPPIFIPMPNGHQEQSVIPVENSFIIGRVSRITTDL